jgi:hypothetical protein
MGDARRAEQVRMRAAIKKLNGMVGLGELTTSLEDVEVVERAAEEIRRLWCSIRALQSMLDAAHRDEARS